MSKKTLSQSLITSVRELDKINNIEVELKGNLQKILKDPVAWAEEQSEKAIMENTDKYLQAKKLGKDFWNEVKRIS
jgi:hypothetical protein